MLRHSEKCSVQLTHDRVSMPYSNRRNCPICCKPDLLSLSHHLSQVHQLSSEGRKPWLKAAIFSNTKTLPYFTPYPFWGMPQQSLGVSLPLSQPRTQTQSTKPRKLTKIYASQCLETRTLPRP